MTRRTFLKVKTCSTSWVRQFAHTCVLDPLRLLAILLRHCLTMDEWGDYFSNNLCCAMQVLMRLKPSQYVSKKGHRF